MDAEIHLPVKNKRKLTAMQRQQERMAYLFITPALIMFLTFVVLPIFMAFYFSLCEYGTNIRKIEFVGFKNYIELFTSDSKRNELFWKSFVNVFSYALMYVPMVVILSLFFAVLVNQKIPAAKVYRVIYYIPSITSGVAAAFVFQFIFSTAEYGLMNTVLSWFNLGPVAWLEEETSMFCISVVSVWGGIGGNMIIYLAALQGISPDLLEAADIDGATSWQKFAYIILPQIAYSTYFIVMMCLIGAFQLYDQVKIMTGEGNQFTTTPVARIFFVAFDTKLNGLANAMAIILFIVIMIVTSINNLIQNKINEKYE